MVVDLHLGICYVWGQEFIEVYLDINIIIYRRVPREQAHTHFRQTIPATKQASEAAKMAQTTVR